MVKVPDEKSKFSFDILLVVNSDNWARNQYGWRYTAVLKLSSIDMTFQGHLRWKARQKGNYSFEYLYGVNNYYVARVHHFENATVLERTN